MDTVNVDKLLGLCISFFYIIHSNIAYKERVHKKPPFLVCAILLCMAITIRI